MNADFAIPGDLNTPSGGYRYDREVLRALPHLHRVTDELSGETPLLIDGLAYAVMSTGQLRGLNRPLVALCHHPLAMETGLTSEDVARLFDSERAALAVMDHVIVTSETTGALLKAQFGVPDSKITVAEPGLDITEPADRAGKPPVILTIGSLTPRKGHDVLLAALGQIADLNWQAEWIGAGWNAQWLDTLEALVAQSPIAHRINRRGALEISDVIAAYQNADIFCLPSHYEGYGMVFGEAMMAGLPIVACAGGAVTAVVPSTAGILTEPGDADALARSLRSVLSEPVTALRMSASARAHALSLPSWSDTAAIIDAVLQKVAK